MGGYCIRGIYLSPTSFSNAESHFLQITFFAVVLLILIKIKGICWICKSVCQCHYIWFWPLVSETVTKIELWPRIYLYNFRSRQPSNCPDFWNGNSIFSSICGYIWKGNYRPMVISSLHKIHKIILGRMKKHQWWLHSLHPFGYIFCPFISSHLCRAYIQFTMKRPSLWNSPFGLFVSPTSVCHRSP